MNKVKTLFFIVDKPLHGDVKAQEFLDTVLMAAAFDQRVILLFEGKGVFALLENQQPELMGLKNVSPILSALTIYDINDVWVEEEALKSLGIEKNQFVIPAKAVARDEIKRHMSLADHVFSF